MKKMLLSLSMVIAMVSGLVSCQVYNQNTNSVEYTLMPADGALEREDVVADIEFVKENAGANVRAELMKIAQRIDETYTGLGINKTTGESYEKTAVEVEEDILLLWDEVYPVEWDFCRE